MDIISFLQIFGKAVLHRVNAQQAEFQLFSTFVSQYL